MYSKYSPCNYCFYFLVFVLGCHFPDTKTVWIADTFLEQAYFKSMCSSCLFSFRVLFSDSQLTQF